MSNERILAVEDEEDILELLRYNLSKEGYAFSGVTAGKQALPAIRKTLPQLIILDLMLPDISGLEICRLIKSDREMQHIPIIMLTARSEEADIVTGLELGAADYITKPFSLKVLIARVRAVLRRPRHGATEQDGSITRQGIIIHPGRHEVLASGQPLHLTANEFKLLHFLAARPGWVFTRDQLVAAVHDDECAVTDRSVDVQIMGLRKKLGRAGQYIETVRGVGYRFME